MRSMKRNCKMEVTIHGNGPPLVCETTLHNGEYEKNSRAHSVDVGNSQLVFSVTVETTGKKAIGVAYELIRVDSMLSRARLQQVDEVA